MEFLSHSEKETFLWAKAFAKTLKSGDVVLLKGDLGAGKTIVAKGIAKGLGIEEEITSPTFAYLNVYQNRLYHFDLYRIGSRERIEELGLLDYFSSGGIYLIEWGEGYEDLFPPHRKIEIFGSGEEERRIEF